MELANEWKPARETNCNLYPYELSSLWKFSISFLVNLSNQLNDGEQLYARILFGWDFLISSANSFAKPKSGVLVSHHTTSAYSA